MILLGIISCFVKITPYYEIFGNIGCEPELVQVTSDHISVDTSYEVNHRLKDQLLYELKGNCHIDAGINDFNAYKIKIPLIMLFDYRDHFGGPNSFGRYHYIEFKLFGIIRKYEISNSSETLYFKSIDDEINDKMVKIGKLFDKGCFKEKLYIDCE